MLDTAYSVQSYTRRPSNRPSRLNKNKWQLKIFLGADSLYLFGYLFHVIVIRYGRVRIGVLDSEAASQIKLFYLVTNLIPYLSYKVHHYLSDKDKGVYIENLASDMAMQSRKLNMLKKNRFFDRL